MAIVIHGESGGKVYFNTNKQTNKQTHTFMQYTDMVPPAPRPTFYRTSPLKTRSATSATSSMASAEEQKNKKKRRRKKERRRRRRKRRLLRRRKDKRRRILLGKRRRKSCSGEDGWEWASASVRPHQWNSRFPDLFGLTFQISRFPDSFLKSGKLV